MDLHVTDYEDSLSSRGVIEWFFTGAVAMLQDIEGVLITNIASYMGGVDLWQNEEDHEDDFDAQYMHDKMLEVVGICGAWHLGKLQVMDDSFSPLRFWKADTFHVDGDVHFFKT